jgi:hypothetical protein
LRVLDNVFLQWFDTVRLHPFVEGKFTPPPPLVTIRQGTIVSGEKNVVLVSHAAKT